MICMVKILMIEYDSADGLKRGLRKISCFL